VREKKADRELVVGIAFATEAISLGSLSAVADGVEPDQRGSLSWQRSAMSVASQSMKKVQYGRGR
jgi:GH43 family beta-xylosidase